MIVILSLCAPVLASDDVSKWYPWLDVEGTATSKRGIGEMDAFLPLWQDGTTLVFGNAKFKGDTEKSLEGNFGLGARYMLDAGWNLGTYGFFDIRRSPYGNTFNQLTVGAEALSEDWDLRANAYLPVGTTSANVDSLNAAALSGTSVVVSAGQEVALGGFDAEIGYRLPAFEEKSPLDLRFYAGGYSFNAPGVPSVTGPRLRAELTSEFDNGARLSFGAGWQRDDVRGSQGFASVRVRVPLDGNGNSKSLSAQERRMLVPVTRDVDIVTQAGAFGASETATQTADGAALTVLSSASTSGANLPNAVVAAGANSLVILSGAFTTNAVTTLQAGQTLMGTGVVNVRTPSGRTATVTTPTASLTSTQNTDQVPAVAMGNNSTLRGMAIAHNATAPNLFGVEADGVSGATIADNTITVTNSTIGGSTTRAVDVQNASNITISGNTINATAAGGNALAVQIIDSSAKVAGNTLNVSGGSNNHAVGLHSAVTILAGSTGNVRGSGDCLLGGGVTGTGAISFTNFPDCEP